MAVGDELVSVNGREPSDIIEYQQLIDGEIVTLVVRREGEELARKVTIAKTEGQPLGLSIDSAVFDRIRTTAAYSIIDSEWPGVKARLEVRMEARPSSR